MERQGRGRGHWTDNGRELEKRGMSALVSSECTVDSNAGGNLDVRLKPKAAAEHGLKPCAE